MIELTEEQRRGLGAAEGAPVRLLDPVTRQEYVLLRADVYEKVRRIIADVNQRADWDDPAFAVYDRDEP